MEDLSDNNKTLHQLNQEMADKLYPFRYVLGVYLTLGVLGNVLVTFVYFWRFKTYSEGRFFIPFLAVIDLVACVVNCSGKFRKITVPIMSGNDIGCKMETYLSTATVLASMFSLLAIAINRYLKICRPFGRQISLKWKKLSIAIIVIAAFIISIPSFVSSGTLTYRYQGTKNFMQICGRIEHMRYFALSFLCFWVFFVTAELFILCVLYFCIWRMIYRQRKFRLQTENDQQLPPDPNKEPTSIGSDDKPDSISMRKPDLSTKNVPHLRITIMFFVITIIFAISYIPISVIKILLLTDLGSRQLSEENILSLFSLWIFYIINNCANPFIYGCMDKKLQLELRKLFCRETTANLPKNHRRTTEENVPVEVNEQIH